MKIICDQREVKSEVPELLKSLQIETEICTLEDGDYLLPNNTIVTRKTYTDFFGSRNSGHFSDELFRLLSKYPNSVIFCIVEKNTYNTKDEIIVATKAIKSMQFILPTIQTRDKRDTAETLIYYAKKAENNELNTFNRRIVLQDNTNPIKKIYMSFPGISNKTADKLYEIYPRPMDMFNSVVHTYQFEEKIYKKKSLWKKQRWDKDIRFIGNKKNEVIGNLLLGKF